MGFKYQIINRRPLLLMESQPPQVWCRDYINSIRHVIKIEDNYNYINSNLEPLIISLSIDQDSDSETELNIE